MPRLALETPLFETLGAKAPYVRRLETLNIKTVGDLLRHFPSRYEDFSKMYRVAELEPGQQATIQAAVEEITIRRTRRGLTIVEAILRDESGSIRAVWFNQPYLANTLRAGRVANFAGKTSLSEESEVYLSHPAYEILKSTGTEFATTQHTARLVPIYPETRGITSRGLRFIMQNMLRRMPPLKEWIPKITLEGFGFPEINQAIRAIHFPEAMDEAIAAKKRFFFEDLFLLQLFNFEQKSRLTQEKAPTIKTDIEKVKSILAKLPFELTPSQKRSLWEIIQDVQKPKPMNRLLQGDVGSGKTVVAAMIAIIAAENGYQTAFMAPTEILAQQHFQTMTALLQRIAAYSKPVTGLLTANSAIAFYEQGMETKLSKDAAWKKIAAGEIMVIFGTHALIQKSSSFHKLGLAIVDEQHRFGVNQRGALIRGHALVPHFLSMSATPIPRTLMLTVFGDLDISLITELPKGRQVIETKMISPLERQGAYDLIRKEIREGRQAFVVCPRIEKSEGQEIRGERKEKQLEIKSVLEEYEKLSKRVFPDLRVAMLHGQMKPKEKEEAMRRFKAREFDILVATSVVEVGVDIPNATIMAIEGIERFGLAQLYQFRGRVGRGEHRSYCLLMADAPDGNAGARLQAIIKAKNGFELAEYDLKLRGPGQFFGQIQTGFPDAMMSALQDPELVKTSRDAAVAIIKNDPTLRINIPLQKKLKEFREKIHQE